VLKPLACKKIAARGTLFVLSSLTGEYYINSTSATLYFYPPAGTPPGPLQGAEVTVNTSMYWAHACRGMRVSHFLSSCAALLTGDGAHHVWFVGITIEAGRGDGISWLSADGLVLLNVTVKVRTKGNPLKYAL